MFLRTMGRLSIGALLVLATIPIFEVATARQLQVGKVGCTARLLTDPEGADFDAYLRDIYRAVKTSWYAGMPPSVEKGAEGINSVQFRVLQDGSVPRDSLKMIYGSGKRELDDASFQAPREAVLPGHLLEKYTKPFVELRFTFYYNRDPQK